MQSLVVSFNPPLVCALPCVGLGVNSRGVYAEQVAARGDVARQKHGEPPQVLRGEGCPRIRAEA
jgi:hypothetical protein